MCTCVLKCIFYNIEQLFWSLWLLISVAAALYFHLLISLAAALYFLSKFSLQVKLF